MDFCQEYELLEDDDHILKSVNYDELMELFSTFNTGLVFIGGAWCRNCQSFMPIVNSLAKAHGLACVYNYDPKFINVFGEEDDLRDCKTLEVKLNYYYLVEKLGFKSDELVVDTLIPKIHVPFFFTIKNGACTGYFSKDSDILTSKDLEDFEHLLNDLLNTI